MGGNLHLLFRGGSVIMECFSMAGDSSLLEHDQGSSFEGEGDDGGGGGGGGGD